MAKIWNERKFSKENTLNYWNNGKILSLYTENTLYCSDVYNSAQKLDNSIQIVKTVVRDTAHPRLEI